MNKLILVGLVVLLASSGCKRKQIEVTPVARAEAAQNAGEGEFAAQIRDYARSEQVLTKAVELDPTVPRYWKELGSARKHLNNVSGARKAYEKSLDLLRQGQKADPKSIAPILGQIETLVLLGKKEDARALLNQAVRDFPNDQQLKAIVDNKVLDKMASDPAIQGATL